MNKVESKQLIDYLNGHLNDLGFPNDPIKRGTIFFQIYAMKLIDATDTYASFEDAQAIADMYFEANQLDLSLHRVPQHKLKGVWVKDDKARKKFWKDADDKHFNKHHFPTDPKARNAYVHEVIEVEHIEQCDYTAQEILDRLERSLDHWEHSEDVNEMEGTNVDNDPIGDIGDEATEQNDEVQTDPHEAEKAEVAAIFKHYGLKVNFQKATQYPDYVHARDGMNHKAILAMVETYCKRESAKQPDNQTQQLSGNTETGLMPYDPVNELEQLRHDMLSLKSRAFTAGVDYDTIPGTGKPSLLLPGMEKIMRMMRLRPEYVQLPTSIIDFDKPLFHIDYECRIVECDTNIIRATAIGSCNSHESKYRYRWVKEHEIPPDVKWVERREETFVEFEFAINNGNTAGKYGKPVEYWERFKQAIQDGEAVEDSREVKGKPAKTWEISGTLYKIPNLDAADQLNTFQKMAQKRALGSAVKLVANASEFFTVDMEKR